MIKAGCILTAPLAFFTISHVSAQSHVIKDGSLWRYAKKQLKIIAYAWACLRLTEYTYNHYFNSTTERRAYLKLAKENVPVSMRLIGISMTRISK